MWRDFGHFEEDELGKPYDVKLMGRLWPFVRPCGRLMWISVVLVLAVTGLELSMPYVTKVAIDRYIVPETTGKGTGDTRRRIYAADLSDPVARAVVERNRERFTLTDGRAEIPYDRLGDLPGEDLRALRRPDRIGIARAAGVFLAAVIAHFALTFIQVMVMEKAGQMIMHDLRVRMFDHLQRLSVAFFSKNPVGRLVTRVTSDVQNMYELFTSVVVFLFKDLFLLAGIAGVLMFMNWRLSLISFAVMPLVVWASIHFANLARDVFRTLRIQVAEINTRFAETIGGIRILQLFMQESANQDRFERLNHENYLAGMRQIHVFAVFMPVIEMLSAVSLAIIVWYGGERVLRGSLSLGELAAFIAYMRMFYRPIRDIAEKHNVMQNAMASAERIFLLLDATGELERSGGRDPQKAGGSDRFSGLRFEDVTFEYEPGRPVLRDVSFTLPRGRTLALVGPTGSGKSTLIQLMMGFYDPTRGRILFNGSDIRNMDLACIRSMTALVPQDPVLFSATLATNVRMGKADLTDEQVRQALSDARCDALIDRLAGEKAGVLSEAGQSISSGERQLVSIARAMARDPELILLDEATSYIDSETEEKIQAALHRLLSGKTAVIVAHRLSTARSADEILVLHDGRILERGTHPQLMAARGFYYRLNRLEQTQALPASGIRGA